MSDRHTSRPDGVVDAAKRKPISGKRLPAVLVLVIAVFALPTLVCVALIAPILWTALTDTAMRPALSYRTAPRGLPVMIG